MRKKCDYRPIDSRVSANSKVGKRKSASRTSAMYKEDYRGIAMHTQAHGPESMSSDLPSFQLVPNYGRGDCFFLCVEKATCQSVAAQRILLSTQMREADLARYQSLLSDSDKEMGAALEARDSASDQRVLRAREILDEMEFRRRVTDLETLRSRVLTGSNW